MGYQESMIFVDNLAEAAGIERAIREVEEREWFYVFGTERACKNLHYGNPWGMNEGILFELCRLIPKGTLAVMVGGQRSPYQYHHRMHFLDGVVELEKEELRKCFEAVDDEELEKASKKDPDITQAAYDQMAEYLSHVWDR